VCTYCNSRTSFISVPVVKICRRFNRRQEIYLKLLFTGSVAHSTDPFSGIHINPYLQRPWFNEIQIFQIDSGKIIMYHENPSSGSLSSSMRTDRQTDRQTDRYDEANDALCYFVNAPI
jgi:hypothetical protein